MSERNILMEVVEATNNLPPVLIELAGEGWMHILKERVNQVMIKGRDANYDDKNNIYGELYDGAKFLLTRDRNDYPIIWDVNIMRKWETKPHKERLIIAGALIAAEIDRLIRKEQAAKEKSETYEH